MMAVLRALPGLARPGALCGSSLQWRVCCRLVFLLLFRCPSANGDKVLVKASFVVSTGLELVLARVPDGVPTTSGGQANVTSSTRGTPPAASLLPLTPLMPWNASWQVPTFALGIWAFGLLAATLTISTSSAAIRHFGQFYRGDISAFLAERWQVSVSFLPAVSLLFFLCCWFRHPLHSPLGSVETWNFVAVSCIALACVGLAGVGVVTQRDNFSTSTYPLQSDQHHGLFMLLAFPCLFLYMIMHATALSHDLVCGAVAGWLVLSLIIVEYTLVLAAVIHFLLWMSESAAERYPDDPKCNKCNEWLCVLCIGCYWLTLPILTNCFQSSAISVQVSGYLAIGTIGCASLFLLCCCRIPGDAEHQDAGDCDKGIMELLSTLDSQEGEGF
mmetsp:Transcript_101508/g.282530  ORF Transcript_101508/g.282530 Transcript_101508/m.282530 type:complete len:387 (-) Transcript_101508:77-1237(-)